MKRTNFITHEHADNLPVIRIKKVILKDFKSVEYGEITLNCGRQFIPRNTEADILGVYGQNGSGKTAFIEALAILQKLMAGVAVPNAYADCVAVGKDYSELEFVFDLQYPDGKRREAAYSFWMASQKLTTEEINEEYEYKEAPENLEIPDDESKVVIYNEKFSLLWEESSRRQIIIDTSSEGAPFKPVMKRKEMAGNGKKVLYSLEVNKQLAHSKSRSFVFMTDTLKIFESNDNKSLYFQVLAELRLFARKYFFVVDTKSSGFIRLNFALPIYTRNGRILLAARKPMIIENEDLDHLRKNLDNISSVLTQLVPGLSIGIKEISETLNKDGNPATSVMAIAIRNGKEFPLRDESDGVRKIISVLSLITAVFNEASVTVAIDEFDAGIFEYLLGEILQIMEEAGKGQFIFTSHNLRPLEVINKKFLYFTTSNPKNRYIRLKNISATNNLRDTYYREIILCEQDEEIYKKTKKFKIVSALKKAGELR